jgi:hypothetical protein
MKKQTFSTAIVMLLLVGILSIAIPFGFATHTSTVYWIKNPRSQSQVLIDTAHLSDQWGDLYSVFSPSARAHVTGTSLNFIVLFVNNTMDADYIRNVEVSIPQDPDGFSYFYMTQTNVTSDFNMTNPDKSRPAADWRYETIESDPNLEVRSFRYVSDVGLTHNATLYIWMYFRGGPEFCTYRFSVRTIDFGTPKGGSPEAKPYDMWLIMDKYPPEINVLEARPVSGETFQGLPLVNGDPRPSGKHIVTAYVNASDYVNCSSGIIGARYEMRLINFSTGAEYWFKNETYEYPFGLVNDPITSEPWIFSKDIWSNNTRNSLVEGKYNLTVKIWDRVGNSAQKTYSFYYRPPSIPTYYAAPETNIANSGTGLVESKQVVYKTKTLGSTVNIRSWNITGFKVGNTPTVRIYIPTYEWYNSTYGTFNVLVNNTAPVDSNGYPTGTFIFPKAPQGTYTVYIAGLDPNGLSLTKYQNVAVIPQIIFNPNEIIGPAAIDVMATGFLKPAVEQPAFATYLLIRESTWEHPKDALMGVNDHVWQNWYIDFNGTLQNWITRLTGVEVAPGFLMPISQPGTYHITLLIQAQFYYWQCIEWLPRTQMSHSNTITVTDWTGDILDAAQGAKTAAEGAKTAADAAKTSADAAKTAADAAKTAADAAKTAADAANATATSALNAASTAADKAELAESAAESAKTAAEGVKTAADSAKTAAEGLTMPVYLAVVLSLIAAIGAAICTILVYRKIA